MAFQLSPIPLAEPKRVLFHGLPSVFEEDNIIEDNTIQPNGATLPPLNLIDPDNPLEQDINLKRTLKDVMMSDQKTLLEAQLLYDHVKHFPFFEAFNERNMHNYLETEAFVQLCQRMKYEKHPAKTLIFQEGEPSKGKLYIIFSGSVYSVTKDANKNPTMLDSAAAESVNSDSEEETRPTEVDPNANKNRRTVYFDLPVALTPKTQELSPEQNRLSYYDIDCSPRHKASISPLTAKSHAPTRELERKRTLGPKGEPYHRPSFFAGVSTILDVSDHSDHKDASGSSFAKLPSKIQQDTIEEKEDEISPTPDDVGFFNFMRMSLVTNRIKNQIQMMADMTPTANSPAKILQRQKTRRKHVWLDKTTLITVDQIPDKNRINRASVSLRQLITKHGFVKSKITSGGFFGERALFSKARRSETIVAKTECEFLVINKRDFRFVSDNYDYKRMRLLDFMTKFIPDFENITTTEKIDILLCAFQEQVYERDHYIIKEGESGDQIYILYEGSCEISKTLKVEEPPRIKETIETIKKMIRVNPLETQDITLCKVESGEFLGLEALFGGRGVYDLSVKVYSSQAKVFAIDKAKFFEKFSYVTTYHLEGIFKMRRQNHIKTISNYISNKHPSYKVPVTIDKIGEDNVEHDLLSRGHIVLVPQGTITLNNKTRQLLMKGSYTSNSPNLTNELSLTKSKTMDSPKTSTSNFKPKEPQSQNGFGEFLPLLKEDEIIENEVKEKQLKYHSLRKKLDTFSRVNKGLKSKYPDEYDLTNNGLSRAQSTLIKAHSNFENYIEKERQLSPLASYESMTRLPTIDPTSTQAGPTIMRNRPNIPSLSTNFTQLNTARTMTHEFGAESARLPESNFSPNLKPILSSREHKTPSKIVGEGSYFAPECSLGFDFDSMSPSYKQKIKIKSKEILSGIDESSERLGKSHSFTRVLMKMKDRIEKKNKKTTRISEMMGAKRKNTIETSEGEDEIKGSGSEEKFEPMGSIRLKAMNSPRDSKGSLSGSRTARGRLDLPPHDLMLSARAQSEEKKKMRISASKKGPVIKVQATKHIINATVEPMMNTTKAFRPANSEYYNMAKKNSVVSAYGS